jgi:hypothetical protein
MAITEYDRIPRILRREPTAERTMLLCRRVWCTRLGGADQFSRIWHAGDRRRSGGVNCRQPFPGRTLTCAREIGTGSQSVNYIGGWRLPTVMIWFSCLLGRTRNIRAVGWFHPPPAGTPARSPRGARARPDPRG